MEVADQWVKMLQLSELSGYRCCAPVSRCVSRKQRVLYEGLTKCGPFIWLMGKKHKTKTKQTGTKLKWEQLRLTMKTMTQEHEHESEQEHKKTQDLT